jgi:predicted nucleic acid-binding protein
MKPKVVLVDTGFWFALYDGKDPHRKDLSGEHTDLIDTVHIAIPWPTLYETINTKFAKNSLGVSEFDKVIRSPKTTLINDASYRDLALHATIHDRKQPLRALSLVDMVIRFILDDVNLRIDALMTFNTSDFMDVCRRRRIEMI